MSIVNVVMRDSISGSLLSFAAEFEGYIDFEVELDFVVKDIIEQIGNRYEFYKVVVL